MISRWHTTKDPTQQGHLTFCCWSEKHKTMSDADEEDASMCIDASMIDTSLIAASPQDAGPSEAEQHDRLSQLEKEMAILQARIRSLKPTISAKMLCCKDCFPSVIHVVKYHLKDRKNDIPRATTHVTWIAIHHPCIRLLCRTSKSLRTSL